MKRRMAFCLMFLAAVFMAGVALAGIYGETVTYKPGQPDQQTVTKMYIEGDKLRIEQPGEKDSTITIYRGDKDLVWMIMPGEKLYQETTKEDIQKMKTQMEQARKMMDEEMKNLSPEQRQQMEKMMGKMPNAPAEQKTETVYKLVGKNEKVNDYTCEHYAAFSDGKKTWDLWTVDYKDVGVGLKDLAPLEALGEFFGQIGGSNAENYLVGTEEPLKGDEGPRFHGMPVKWTDVEADSVVRVNELKVLEKRTLDAGLFELPKGFKKTDKPTFPGNE
jgi:hypothetical protein